MRDNYDAVIIGAGIIGCACALECVNAGMRIALVERNVVAAGATGAAMGHVVLMDDSPSQFALTRFGQRLWNDLAPDLPPEVEYYRPGTIWVAADQEELAAVQRTHDFYVAAGVTAEMLDAQSLAEAEPNLRSSFAGGLLVSSDVVLNPSRAATFLLENAQRQADRVTLFLGKAVMSAGHGLVILEDRTELKAPILINATGANAPELTPGLLIRKRKGHLMLTESYPEFAHHQLVELGYLKSAHASDADSVAFNIQPRKNGQLLIGSSRQYGIEDLEVEHGIVDAMMERAALYMPRLAELTIVRVWSGLRAATPHKLPLIGPTEDPSLFLATGHEGLGITTSLATARLLVDHLLNRQSAIPIEPYLPNRRAKIDRTIVSKQVKGNKS